VDGLGGGVELKPPEGGRQLSVGVGATGSDGLFSAFRIGRLCNCLSNAAIGMPHHLVSTETELQLQSGSRQ
jgi:hypothetical protein